ncbi:hypothetical protein JG688_00004353 [Phytophthora aleatoria]|uniref:F-box domain-containing protein n=1 Tax=Phytophthora aleatoria TaxID=2496075 RepID=A0A8J5J3G5_9STRA|nr:hypothetical protein JG688_00004353 [Phytophthora aleatoria]
MVASAATSAVGVSRTIELLAPLYAEVCQHLSGRATSVPVTLQRTADDWLQLVFPGPNVRKDVACVNGASGCRCDFVRFLRSLLVLTERQIVTMSATYAVTPRSIDQNRVATLQLRLRVHEDAQRGTSLKDFDFVLCHLQATVLTIVARNEQARKEALNAALEEARNSSCHVVGCRLHPWDKTVQPKQKLNLPDVFHSLTSQMEVDQMEIRDDATYVARLTRPNKKIVMTDLPTNVLQNIVCLMNARDLASLSGVCSLFQHMAYEVVPGLNLVLYEHQRRGLKWMLRRETPVGPICFRCNAVFDREAFQRLQPGFEFEMVEAVALEANNPGLNQEANGQNGRNAPRQPRRAMDLTRDIHFIDASKAFYAATRIKELKEEFLLRSMNPSGRSSRCQARYLKAIIFSQFKDHIWHTKVAFAQQGVPTADFIAGLSPEVRMKQLARFRKDPNVNVLLLTEVGSHGLDLSFVTHIFLMDEIWDKALEQQVISRAHRMGANQAVVVEQLWMRGSVESQMLKPHETDENQIELDDKPEVLASPTRAKAQQGGSPGRSPKKTNTGGGTMFNAPSKKRKRHRTEGDARTAAKSNKNTILQRKLNYVLHKLRLLEEDIVGEPGQRSALHDPTPKPPSSEDMVVIDSSSGDESKEADDEGEKEDDIEPVTMVQNARRCWEKQRRIVAALNSGDNEVKLPATKVMRAEVKATTKTTIVVKSKAKAVSFRIIDDDDSESE